MNNRSIEFYIENSVTGSSGKTTAIGRGGDQIVRVGTHFVAMYKFKKREYPHGLEKPAEIECRRTVDLKVEDVTSYGKKMDFLPGNSTGCLVFTEQGTELLPSGWVLSTYSDA